jgi:hypothetical protein
LLQLRWRLPNGFAPTGRFGMSAALEDFFGFPGKLFPALRRLRKDETYAKCTPTVGASKQYNAIEPKYVCLIMSNSK